MKTMRMILLSVLLCALLLPGALAASAIPQPGEDFCYLDNAGVLTDETKGEIFFSNERLLKEKEAEFVVVTVTDLGGYAIDDYAYELYNSWGIKNDGLLLVLLVKRDEQEDNYTCMPGSTLGTKLTSGEIDDLLLEYLEPAVLRQDYDSGVRSFFEAAFDKMASLLGAKARAADGKKDYEAEAEPQAVVEPRSAAPAAQSSRNVSSNGGGSGMGVLILIVLVIVLIALSRSRARRRTVYYDNPTYVQPTSNRGFGRGFLLGSLLSRRSRAPRPPMGGAGSMPRGFGTPPTPRSSQRPTSFGGGFGGSSGSSRSSFGSSSRSISSRSSFGGSSRSSFGGFSRGSSSRSSFGGSSRSSSRGSTRGGGSGRFSKR